MRPAFVQDVKKRKKDIQVVRIVKDVMTNKIEQVFDLFAAQHEQNERCHQNCALSPSPPQGII